MDSTNNFLPQLLLGDAVSASAAAVGVAPFVTIIDRSIFRSAAGTHSLLDSIKDGFAQIFREPGKFIRGRDLRLVWGVYAGTYTAANMATTICEERGINSEIPKFIITSLANLALCIRKDAIFAKMFGTSAAPVPFTSLSLFTLRDSLTTIASFNLPGILSTYIQESTKDTSTPVSRVAAANFSQLFCPVGIQFFSTPIHLFALDLYNRPGQTFASRTSFIQGKYVGMVAARCTRILPAFGIGGITNRMFRENWRQMYGKAL